MKGKQLIEVFSVLDPNKRIKFQNKGGWGDKTMSICAILEEGNVYICIWACHPKCIKDDMKETQKLIWYNPNKPNYKLITNYFPEYGK